MMINTDTFLMTFFSPKYWYWGMFKEIRMETDLKLRLFCGTIPVVIVILSHEIFFTNEQSVPNAS